jgi:hydrogenase/urease accessory protein HupE
MTSRALLFSLVALFLGLAGSTAKADNFSPAYLEMTERGRGVYDVRWKTPAQSEVIVMPIKPVFPASSRMNRPLASTYAAGAVVMTGQIIVPGGIEGKEIRFDGLAETGNQALVRFIRLDGGESLYKVAASDPGLTFPEVADSIDVSTRYTLLGIEHIWAGFDHLLFVAALVILVGNLSALIWTITSFTLAHSITLALVTLGIIEIAVPPVEAFIALSIVFVAVEVVRKERGETSLASRKPWIVAFAFGLLHGLGFASALAEVGLPQNNIPLALLFFNIGVEIGQLAFVLALLALAQIAGHLALHKRLSAARLAAAYLIGGLASYWLLDRISGFA